MQKVLSVIATVTLACLMTGEVANAATSPSTADFASMSPAQIVTLSLANAQRAGSCTNVSQGTAVGYTFGSTTTSGNAAAQQLTHFNASTGRVLLIGDHLFVKESAALLSLQFRKADPKWANKWLSIPRGNSAYVPLASGLLFSAMMSQVRPSGALHKSKLGTLNGVAVIAVAGDANATLGLSKGVETLFVATTAPYLPVELLAGGRSQGVPTSLKVTFSHWGRRVSYSAPTDATPISATDLR